MNAGDFVYFDGLDRIWVEPRVGRLPRIGPSRTFVGWILEPAEDDGEATVQLRTGFELSGERMMIADILDEILGPLEDSDIVVTVTEPTPLVPAEYWDR